MTKRRITHFFDCPVAQQAMRTRASAEALVVSLSRLRRMMRQCPKCASASSCPMMIEFNQAFRIALEEINQEWDQGAAS